MKQLLRAVLAALAVAAAPMANVAQERPAGVNFDELRPVGFGVLARDAEASVKSWADVFGVQAPAPRVFQNAIFLPPYAAEVGPKIVSLQTANVGMQIHQPGPGKTYWKDLLDARGEVLYRSNMRVHGLEAVVAHFLGHGGKLGLGDPTRTGYVNVYLPSYGFALEINEIERNAIQTANAPVLVPASTSPAAKAEPTAFASNPVSKISFVVPKLEQAVKDYRKLFGLPDASVVQVTRASGIPLKSTELRFGNGTVWELNEPQGGSSIWRTHLQKHGRSMISVAFRVKSVPDQVAYLTSKGGKLVLGGGGAPYAFFDFTSRLGAVIEIHE